MHRHSLARQLADNVGKPFRLTTATNKMGAVGFVIITRMCQSPSKTNGQIDRRQESNLVHFSLKI